MAQTIKILSRDRLEGGGFNTAGVAKNLKERVVAEVTVTVWTANGEPLTPNDLGLETIDDIQFDVVSVNDAATVPIATAIPLAAYDRTGQRVICISDHGTDTPVVTGEAAVYRCVAFGDSARAPELT